MGEGGVPRSLKHILIPTDMFYPDISYVQPQLKQKADFGGSDSEKTSTQYLLSSFNRKRNEKTELVVNTFNQISG